MWLPTPVYESLPYAYVTVGILFISGAAYIGLGQGESTLYLGVGAASVLAGIFVYIRRLSARAKRREADAAESESS